MPIDLFDPAQSQNNARFGDDVVGRFRSGYQVNDRPASLTEWRVTTDDPTVADYIHDTFGGEDPQEWKDELEVFTKAKSVDIVIEKTDAVEARMLIWARGSKRIVTCDNEVFETEGRPYECEKGGFRTKKQHEEQGHVCEPRVTVTFRLADNPDLGLFRFESGAWSLATSIAKPLGDLAKVGGPAKATLALEVVEYESGGKPRKFTKPVLTIVGPA